jgi:hypothetical protein
MTGGASDILGRPRPSRHPKPGNASTNRAVYIVYITDTGRAGRKVILRLWTCRRTGTRWLTTCRSPCGDGISGGVGW